MRLTTDPNISTRALCLFADKVLPADLAGIRPELLSHLKREARAKRAGQHDALADRAAFAGVLKHFAEAGRVWVLHTSTDCDHTRGEYLHQIPASVLAWDRMETAAYDCAEGPQSFSLLHAHEAEEYRPQTRDLALEAWEDGHPHCIHA